MTAKTTRSTKPNRSRHHSKKPAQTWQVPAIEPLLMIQSFYRLVNALAIARGRDPDHPPHLRKVTETM